MQRKEFKVAARDEEIYEALSDANVFADLYNGSVFEGKQVIKAEYLEQVNEKQVMKAQGRDGQGVVIKRYRDINKRYDYPESVLSVVLAAEGQREVDYRMPVRNMFYDALDYSRQIQELGRQNRNEKKLHGSSEFLSGLTQKDRLMPIMTLALYYGEKQDWDGPLCLHDMLTFPKELLPWKEKFADYPLNLVYSHNVNPANFRTGLSEVFELLRVADDKEAMRKLLTDKSEHYRDLDWDRAKLLGSFLDIPMVSEKSKIVVTERGGVNMCTAFQEMYREGELKGELNGEVRYNSLIKKLLEEGQLEDLRLATEDMEYRRKLFVLYDIKS